MKPVDKAVWYIESHYQQDIDLDLLARAAGMPVIRYLRWPRLSQAARALAGAGTKEKIEG